MIVNTQKLAPMTFLYDAYQSKNGKKGLDELGISKHLPHGVPSYMSWKLSGCCFPKIAKKPGSALPVCVVCLCDCKQVVPSQTLKGLTLSGWKAPKDLG